MAPDLVKMLAGLEAERSEIPKKRAHVESALPADDEHRAFIVSELDKQAEAMDQAIAKLREMLAA